MGRLFTIWCIQFLAVFLVSLCSAAEGNAASSRETDTEVNAWFNTDRGVNCAVVLTFSAVVLLMLSRGKRGRPSYIRPIAGLHAMEDAVGRAAEMGRAVIYIPGLTDVSDPATAASLSILSNVGYRAARLRTRVLSPNFSPLTFPVVRSVLKEAHLRAGMDQTFNPDDVAYFTSRHMTYTMAVVGMMTRERVAANFLIGHFYSESLILAETGAALGAKQIGGCDSVTQLPFFITTCDYTLIGEELFAADAVISKDPMRRATIAAHDYVKAAAILLIIAGVVLTILDAAGVSGAGAVLQSVVALFKEGR
jgi:hypothetical protein